MRAIVNGRELRLLLLRPRQNTPLCHRLFGLIHSTFALDRLSKGRTVQKCRLSTSARCHFSDRSVTAAVMKQDAPPKEKRTPAVPRPSSSVLVISPTNEILLLHRVKNSSTFASAYVFPGGNLDSYHDGNIPAPDDPLRHEDSEAYRIGAIRETFEESGILLAKNNGFGRLIEVEDKAREKGRKLIHGRQMPFLKWLAGKGGRPDVDALIPFTRWVTPTHMPKRFTTQMYIYFLPLAASSSATGPVSTDGEALIPTPTHDGGIEHTAARFLPPSTWISMAQAGEIIMFPPQFLLLTLIAPYLSPPNALENPSRQVLAEQRQRLKDFLKTSNPPWGEKCISPVQMLRRKSDGRGVLALDKPGPELKGTNRKGLQELVVLVDFKKEGPRNAEIATRKAVFEAERAFEEKEKERQKL